jgi:hypothetical protein
MQNNLELIIVISKSHLILKNTKTVYFHNGPNTPFFPNPAYFIKYIINNYYIFLALKGNYKVAI